jgi:hypothetical protein
LTQRLWPVPEQRFELVKQVERGSEPGERGCLRRCIDDPQVSEHAFGDRLLLLRRVVLEAWVFAQHPPHALAVLTTRRETIRVEQLRRVARLDNHDARLGEARRESGRTFRRLGQARRIGPNAELNADGFSDSFRRHRSDDRRACGYRGTSAGRLISGLQAFMRTSRGGLRVFFRKKRERTDGGTAGFDRDAVV